MEQTGGSSRGGSRLPTERFEAINRRLLLFEIGSLRMYEQPDRPRVDEIRQSLSTSGVMINPVIIDPDRRLLIDGHHRVQAFKELGLSHIPAFTVDYSSEDVYVRGWARAFDASAHDVERAFRLYRTVPGGPWAVIAVDSENNEVARLECETAREGARHLHELSQNMEAQGHTVSLEVEPDPLRPDRIYSYIKPVVGKEEVLDIVDREKVFPHEVNRHLIEGRPLSLNVPMGAVARQTQFEDFLEQLPQHAQPLSLDPGYREGRRVYEERVALLQPRRSDS